MVLANKKTILSVLLGFLCLVFSGCATMYNPATGQQEFILIDTQDEIQIGKNVAEQVRQEYPLYRDQKVNDYVSGIGRNIVSVNDRQDLPYYFTILDADEVNAFTIPGGGVYVFHGLLKYTSTDDELAGVLAHEVGHAAARHIVKKMQAQMGYQIILALATRGQGEYQNIAGLANTAFNLVMLGYSREDEYFADILAVRYMQKAGYNPEAMISFLEKLKEEEKGSSRPPVFLSSHPGLDERITRIKEEIAKSRQGAR